MKLPILTIIGPTASGKTKKAVGLSQLISGEIISGDSRQVYRGMDIGTGKDLEDYKEVPYHLIDICEAGEKYNLYRYLNDFQNSLEKILKVGKTPVLCGGSGLYIETVLSGINLPEVPEDKELRDSLRLKTLDELTEILKKSKVLHNITDIDTKARAIRAIEIEEFYRLNPEIAKSVDKEKVKKRDSIIIGIDISREERRKRISRRLESRLEEGLIDEVKNLLDSGLTGESLIYYGLEYKFVTLYLLGQLSFAEMKEKLEIAIHQFAKRQMTWFRGMEKRGYKIHWLAYNLSQEEFNSSVISIAANVID